MISEIQFVQLKMLPEKLSYSNMYSEEELNEIKADLQVEIGAAISKIRFYSRKNDRQFDLRFVCKNRRAQGCLFQFVFQEARPNQFALESHQIEHHSTCYFDSETKAFFLSRNRLIRMKPWIAEFVRHRDSHGLHEKPMKLLALLNKELDMGTDNFIECGVQTMESKIKLKKKFDNIVNEIRVGLKREQNSDGRDWSKVKEEYKHFKQDALTQPIKQIKPTFVKIQDQQPSEAKPDSQTVMSEALKEELNGLQSTNQSFGDLVKFQVPEFVPLKFIYTPIKQPFMMDKAFFDPSPYRIDFIYPTFL